MENEWVERVVLAMNESAFLAHGTYHGGERKPYNVCNLGTCGRLNPLILEAQQRGFGLQDIPNRITGNRR